MSKTIKAYQNCQKPPSSFLMPLFDYFCIILENCYKTRLLDLEKLQKRTARLILNDTREPTTRSHVLVSKLKWMPLQDKSVIKIKYYVTCTLQFIQYGLHGIISPLWFVMQTVICIVPKLKYNQQYFKDLPDHVFPVVLL